MAFENDAKAYVQGLCSDGTFITGDLVGVNSELDTAEARVAIAVDGTNATQKRIIISRIDGIFNWKYYDVPSDPMLNDSQSNTALLLQKIVELTSRIDALIAPV